MDSIQYIKESCEIQHAITPEDYIGMALAWSVLFEMDDTDLPPHVSPAMMLLAAMLVDKRNENGYRKIPVTFSNGNEGEKPENIPRQIQHLVEYQDTMDPQGFYQRFEEIHPFIDGNGRVGSLLFNYLNRTLHDPIHPGEFQTNL